MISRVTSGSEGFLASSSWSVDGVVSPGADDIVILGVLTDSANGPNATPDGFTSIGSQIETGNDWRITLYWKRAATGPYVVPFAGNESGVGFWVSYSGCNVTTPMDVAMVSAPSGGVVDTDIVTPSITPTTVGAKVVGIANTESGTAATMAWDGGISEALDAYTSSGPPNFGVWVGDKNWFAGATTLGGAITAGKTTSKVALALRPAAAGGGDGPLGVAGDWDVIFEDTFSGGTVDLDVWQPNWHGPDNTSCTKGINEGEDNCICPAMSTVSGGNLEMRVITQTTTCGAAPWIDMPYRAATIHSDGNFEFTYGAAEALMYLPAESAGIVANWPAFWLTGQDWPTTGEIDVLEGLGGEAAFNFHYDSDPGAGQTHAQSGPDRPVGDWTGWHTFACVWTADQIDYYYDGNLVGSVDEGVTGAPLYLVLSHVTSDDAGDPTVPDGDPVLVDYVRVWQPSVVGPEEPGGGGPGPGRGEINRRRRR